MAKKSNYTFPIERNTALEVAKIIQNFYLLAGASGEELLAKRSGLSTKLLLGGIGENVVTQELLNNIYANLNNEESLISIIKESFQSINYEDALFLLRWTKDSQSPYYPRGMGEKPVEQFNEDYDFAKNLLVAYINDNGITSIKNLPGRVIRVHKDMIKEIANGYRDNAISEARKNLTTNQEALTELRASIKEQKQKIADLKAADENAITSELEAKLKDDRNKAMELYKVVKGERRSLRDTLEERAILDRDFAEVVGGKMVARTQNEAENEEYNEKENALRKLQDIVKKTPNALPNPQQTFSIITLNVKGKFNETEVKLALGEPLDDSSNTIQTNNYQDNSNNTQNINTEISLDNEVNNSNDDNTTNDGGITPEQTAVVEPTEQNTYTSTENIQQENIQPQMQQPLQQPITQEPINVENSVAQPETNLAINTEENNNGQDIFNAVYNETLQESQEQQNMQQPQQFEQAPQTSPLNNNPDINGNV